LSKFALYLADEATMSTNVTPVSCTELNLLPILEQATQEVFEIMLGCKVQCAKPSEKMSGITAIVGLAGALCGVVTICCEMQTAAQIAKGMLGDAADCDAQAVDALGEMCNMIAGNFKNKLAGTDERCMLSVPSVISGSAYRFHSLVDGISMETAVRFGDAPVTIRLQLKN
jgi:chemotaxis protein CheX